MCASFLVRGTRVCACGRESGAREERGGGGEEGNSGSLEFSVLMCASSTLGIFCVCASSTFCVEICIYICCLNYYVYVDLLSMFTCCMNIHVYIYACVFDFWYLMAMYILITVFLRRADSRMCVCAHVYVCVRVCVRACVCLRLICVDISLPLISFSLSQSLTF